MTFKLNEEQKDELVLQWLKQSVKKSELIINDFLEKHK